MPYSLLPDDPSPTEALRRIARSELGDALKMVRATEASSLVHSLRKNIKKTRGLLRLVQPNFEGFSAANAALRDAAAGISGLRDAEVMRLTLAELLAARHDPAGAAAAQAMLEALPPFAHAAPDHAAIATFAEAITAQREAAARWQVSGKGWKAYAPGLHKSFAQGRKLMAEARSSGSDEVMHRWRSRVKHHWYHARLMAPIWPEMLEAHSAAADTLGELLGTHHDLSVLRAAIPAHLPEGPAAALDQLARAAQQARAEAAFALGARLYAETPEALTDRWGAWFELWRRG